MRKDADAQTNTEPMDDDVIEQADVESQDDAASSEDVVEPMSPEMIKRIFCLGDLRRNPSLASSS